MSRITDRILNDIAQAVGTKQECVMNLGFALGFQKSSIDRYLDMNYQHGKVSLTGTREMLFDWKRDTRPTQQISALISGLYEAKLTEIAEELIINDQLQDFLCLKCDEVIGRKSDVINTIRSEGAKRSKVRTLMGKECLVQLMGAGYIKPIEVKRFDVIILTTANVRFDDQVYPTPTFEGYGKHRPTWCKRCSEQVGWYFLPTDGQSHPFHALWLQRLIHDSYDSDNSVAAFFFRNQIETQDVFQPKSSKKKLMFHLHFLRNGAK